jgi:hypothetical protein
MVMIAGDIPVVTVLDCIRPVGEAIPDAFSFSVFIPGAFDLVSGCSHAPDKVFGKILGQFVLSRMTRNLGPILARIVELEQ